MPFSTGQVINNRYRIVRLLASGGFGTVYRAWDITLNHACALKESLAQTPDVQRQFTREANLLAQLSHPNLPRVTDHFTIPGQGQFLVMDFIEGEDLETMRQAQNGALSEAQALPWILQVCDALTYLHEQTPAVIHRDVKPANIRITPQGKAVLVDFGIAKQQLPGQVTSTGAKAVTPGYSPPEQYTGSGTDQRTDVYALGATLYTLLTGIVLPESINRIISQGGGAPATVMLPEHVRPGISKTVSSAIMQAIRPSPAQRFASVADFRAALLSQAGQCAQKPQSSTAAPPVIAQPKGLGTASPFQGPGAVQGKGNPRSKAVLWAGIALAVLLVAGMVGAGIYFSRQPGSQPPQVARAVTATGVSNPVAAQLPSDTPAPSSHTATAAAGPATQTSQPGNAQTQTEQAASPVNPQPTAPGAAFQSPTPLPTPQAGSFNAVNVYQEPSGTSGLRVELLYPNGAPIDGRWVGIYKQTVDVSNNPLMGDRLASGYTDKSGSVSFEQAPGMHALEISDLTGYPWGSPYNYEVKAGSTTVVRVSLGGLVIGLRNAEGQPLKGHWVGVYVQKQDLLGNPVVGDRIASAYTNEGGLAEFSLTPGLYSVQIGDLLGEVWGNELNHAVLPGQTDQILVTTGTLLVGVVNADGEPVKGVWVGAYYQRPDVAGNPVFGDRFATGYTDQTGSIRWNINAGTYGVQIGDLTGYPWGDEMNHTITSGQQTTILVELGRLVVGLKDGSGSPVKGRWVGVYLQRQDANGSLAKGDRIATGYTDAAGLLTFNLTAGHYVVEVENVGTLMDVVIEPRRVTVTDGITQSFR